MITLYLKRFKTGNDGTFGELQNQIGGHLFYTVECPWKNNIPFKSCIPPGWHDTKWRESPKRGYVLEFKNVLDGRKYCQIHSANWAYQLQGCIALGSGLRKISSKSKNDEIMGVSSSRNSMAEFIRIYENEEIRIIIENLF